MARVAGTFLTAVRMQVGEGTWTAAEMERQFGFEGPNPTITCRPMHMLPLRDPSSLEIRHVMALTKVLTKVLLVDVHLTTWIDPRSRWTSEKIGAVFLLFMPISSLSALYFLRSCAICLFSADAAEGQSMSSPATGRLGMKPTRPALSSCGPRPASPSSAGLPNDLGPSSRKRCSRTESYSLRQEQIVRKNKKALFA